MSFINSFWSCLGSNSGQIQIIIAVGAIGLAFAAYQKVLEQIKISNKQLFDSEVNRFYELKFNLIKAVNEASSQIQLLHDQFLCAVDMFFFHKMNFNSPMKQLNNDVAEFSNEVLCGRGLNNTEYLKEKLEFLDATFVQINNPELKAEHMEKILSKIYESDLRIDQIKLDLERMKHLIEAMKNFGEK